MGFLADERVEGGRKVEVQEWPNLYEERRHFPLVIEEYLWISGNGGCLFLCVSICRFELVFIP